MDSRDRDRERNARKEQALERMLPGALAGDAAGATPSAESCPDAELLAAFYERSLAIAEVTHWRAHFAGCRRCQLSLAALAASDPRPLAEKEVERLGQLVADATAPQDAGDSPLRAQPRKMKLPWFLDPRALAPMAAAAAFVAAVGLTIHTQRSALQLESQNANSQQVIVAENRGEPAPPVLQMPAPSEESRAAAPSERKQSAQPPAPSAAGVTAQRQEMRAESTAPAAQIEPAAAAPPPPPAPAPSEATDRAQAENGAAPGGNSETAGETAAPRPESAPAEAPSASANAPASGAAAPAAPASAPAEAHAATSHVRREKGVVYLNNSLDQNETVEGKLIGANAPGSFIATSPDGQTRWRFGRGGLIERTTNATAATADQKWTQQKSPLYADLLAGSAPLPTVCWIVGRAGAILRTTDGAAWQVIPSPASAARHGAAPDWVGVSARDANSATITSADGRTFTTIDAGKTWQSQ
jgi:hypothetical protein